MQVDFEAPQGEVGLGKEGFPEPSGHCVKVAPSPASGRLGPLWVLTLSLGYSQTPGA